MALAPAYLSSGVVPQGENLGYQNGVSGNRPIFQNTNPCTGANRVAAPRKFSGNQQRQPQGADLIHFGGLEIQKYGLSTSRWAPKGYGRRSAQCSEAEIWTRTVQVVQPQLNDSAPISKPPDLGLPYEVQHYILSMIQRILEEGCYDFAARWVPHKLAEFNWSCPELVELSTWKQMLPDLVPPNAIIPVPGTDLEKSLADAVSIRNSAVHRHLCDNIEIKRMAQQAQNLMAMFSDVTRQNKLHHLQLEMGEWDVLSQRDPQTANSKLQMALQEVSERPLNDMDWTPNAVSLEEVVSEKLLGPLPAVKEIVPVEQFYSDDQMELD
ncbi:hypothetical protein LSUE1_G003362 [Lachnellula suecica]|uniref:Uncharacterized protein n=1 Tax=Lachnellula suecica TaxID=602035 RepID=A0A8T9CBC4_9HELO|nr:hypothetical protein LSUE1_G003362 [Lachnellula suecica]